MNFSTKERLKAIPAAYSIFKKNNKILLSKRKNTGYFDGYYSLVAGHLEERETFRQAIIRESLEEIGVHIDLGSLEICHVMHRYEDKNPEGYKERIDVFIYAKSWKNNILNMEPNKCSDLIWCSIEEIPENTIPYIKHALESIKKKDFYSEFGF